MEKKDDVLELNLYQRLAKVRDIADVVQKNKSGYGYRYVSEDEILAKVKAGMSRYRVSIYPKIMTDEFLNEPRNYEKSKYDKASGQMITTKEVEWVVNGVVVYTILNDDKPEERFEVAWPICGTQSDMSQAFGSAMTYANRYFYLKFFNIATSEDDPDEWKRKKMEAADAEDEAAARATVQKIDEMCRSNINDANRDEVKNLIKKFAKDGTANYKKIKKLDEANALYAELKNYFEKTEAK